MRTTQVFFKGRGQWGEWAAINGNAVFQYITKPIKVEGVFSLTDRDHYVLKYSKKLDEMEIRILEPGVDETECAFRKLNLDSRRYFRDYLVFEVDTKAINNLFIEVTKTLDNTDTSRHVEVKAVKKNNIDIDLHQLSFKNNLTIKEVSALTNLKTSYIYKLTSTQQIPHYKPNGKIIFFNRVEIEEWMQKNKRKSIDTILEAANNHITNNPRF